MRAEVTRYVRAVNNGNPDSLAALYLQRAGVASIGEGEIHRGWQTIADLVRGLYQQFGWMELETDSVTVLPLGTNAGLAYFRYRWSVGRENPQVSLGAMTLVFVRTPEGWRVAHDHTSALAGGPMAGVLPGPQTEPRARAPLARAPGGRSVPADTGPAAPVRTTTECVITRIIDGDTVDCQPGGRVRLIGMDTPEQGQRPYFEQATEAVAALIPRGSTVQLELDVEPRDRYGRILAYLWKDDQLVNWIMVREGWAVLLTYPPNVQYVDWFSRAQSLAREEQRGLWATGGFDCLPADRRARRC